MRYQVAIFNVNRVLAAMNPRFIILLVLSVALSTSGYSQGLTLTGSVTKEGVPLPEAEVKIFQRDAGLSFRYADASGSFQTQLELEKEYLISVKEPGYETATLAVITELPKGVTGSSFEQAITINLEKLKKSPKGKTYREVSAGGVMYNKSSNGFIKVDRDISRLKEEMAAAAEAKKRREEERKKAMAAAKEQARLDSIVRAKEQFIEDSIANAEQFALDFAKKREQEVADSIAAVEAHLAKMMAKRAADREANASSEQTKLDELAAAQQKKLRLDAIANAKKDSASLAQQMVLDREKFVADSIVAARLAEKDEMAAAKQAEKDRKKAAADSISAEREAAKLARDAEKEAERLAKEDAEDAATAAKVEADKLKEEARLAEVARKQAVKDSVVTAKAEDARLAEEMRLAEEARKQAVKDSVIEVKAEQARVLEEARVLEVAQKQASLDSIVEVNRLKDVAEQARVDSVAQVREEARVERLRQQEEVERKEQAYTDSISFAKAEVKRVERERVADLRKDNTVDEETKEEEGKTTITTRVNVYGVKNTYEKVSHSWGQVYYYKNGAIISEAIYIQDIKSAREELP
ncbi:MAG: hypothetical protein ACI9FU_000627 [Granulosicoccus sp.]